MISDKAASTRRRRRWRETTAKASSRRGTNHTASSTGDHTTVAHRRVWQAKNDWSQSASISSSCCQNHAIQNSCRRSPLGSHTTPQCTLPPEPTKNSTQSSVVQPQKPATTYHTHAGKQPRRVGRASSDKRRWAGTATGGVTWDGEVSGPFADRFRIRRGPRFEAPIGS